MTTLLRGLRGPWGAPVLAGALILLAAALSLTAGVNPFGAGHGGLGLALDRPAPLLASDLLMVLAAVVAGARILRQAVRALMVRTLPIDLLVSIAAIGALVIGEYWEAAAVTVLFAIGHALEAGTMNRTRSALAELVAVAPEVAVVLREGRQREIRPRSRHRRPCWSRTVPKCRWMASARDRRALDTPPSPGIDRWRSPRKSGVRRHHRHRRIPPGGRDRCRRNTTLARIIHRRGAGRQGPHPGLHGRFSSWYTPIILLARGGARDRDAVLGLLP